LRRIHGAVGTAESSLFSGAWHAIHCRVPFHSRDFRVPDYWVTGVNSLRSETLNPCRRTQGWTIHHVAIGGASHGSSPYHWPTFSHRNFAELRVGCGGNAIDRQAAIHNHVVLDSVIIDHGCAIVDPCYLGARHSIMAEVATMEIMQSDEREMIRP